MIGMTQAGDGLVATLGSEIQHQSNANLYAGSLDNYHLLNRLGEMHATAETEQPDSPKLKTIGNYAFAGVQKPVAPEPSATPPDLVLAQQNNNNGFKPA